MAMATLGSTRTVPPAVDRPFGRLFTSLSLAKGADAKLNAVVLIISLLKPAEL